MNTRKSSSAALAGLRWAVPIAKREGVMNARTPYLKLLSASTMALLVILVAGYLMSERASAQRLPQPSDPVLDAVQQVQRSIVGLQVNLDALQQGLDLQLAPLGVNVRFTPAFDGFDLGAGCKVVNVGDVSKRIHQELISDGEVVIETTLDLDPGAVSSFSLGQRRTGGFFCKFTVLNGTRADIRGALIINAGGQLIALPAE